MPGLQYRETIAIDSGGYPGEGVGSNGHTNWTDAAMSGTSSVSYYYHDSDYANDNNSSKVTVVITTTWTAVQNNDNSIDVTFSSVIDSLSRGDIRGNPGTVGRTITIYNKPGGSVVWGPQSTAVQTPATYISTDVPIATQTVHIAPQSEANLASLYYLNVMHGYEGRPLPNIGTDAMRMGVFFRNTLPPDYRPGKTWDGNIWQSHNREAGTYVGKNKFDIQRYYNGVVNDNRDATLTFENDAITWTNNSSDSYLPAIWNHSAFSLHQDDAIPVEPSTTYTLSFALSGNISNGAVYIYEGDASYNGINNDHVRGMANTSNVSLTFTTSATTKYIIVRLARWENTHHPVTISRIQLELGSAATSYEPYGINYPAGAADIWTSTSSRRTMRTQDGASGSNNPPQIYHTPGVKLNMRKIGEHA